MAVEDAGVYPGGQLYVPFPKRLPGNGVPFSSTGPR